MGRLGWTMLACLTLGCGSSGTDDPDNPSADADVSGDDTAPSFGGVESVSPVGSSGLLAKWSAATDDVSAAGDIVYRVYVAESAGGQSFASPDVVSDAGATEAVVSGLTSDTTYHVVVRAVDTSGNEDANTKELSGATNGQVSFSTDVQPILTSTCLGNGCHDFPQPQAKLDLRAGSAYGDLVNVPADQCSARTRVIPSDPDQSYVISKLTGVDMCSGSQMPKAGGLPPADLLILRDWIADGALDN